MYHDKYIFSVGKSIHYEINFIADKQLTVYALTATLKLLKKNIEISRTLFKLNTFIHRCSWYDKTFVLNG